MSWLDTVFDLGGQVLEYNLAQDATRDTAESLNRLGDRAVSMTEFRPYSVTSGYGSSFFDPTTQTAGYQLNPVLEAFRNRLYGGSADVFDQLNLDPQEAAQQYIESQQGLLAPTRQAEDIALRNQQLNRGRIGLGISGSAMGAGGAGMINPEQYQRDLARSRVDAEISANALDRGEANIDRYLNRALGMFNAGAGVEQLGQSSLTLGADLGKAGSAAGSDGADALLRTGAASIGTNYQAAQDRIDALSGLRRSYSGMFTR